MRPISSGNTVEAASMPSLSPPAMAQPRSPWHSPVPYLFGGLATMLGLIAFALLILACSYWRLSGLLDNHGEGGDAERDVESGENEGESTKPVKVYEEKILVIMAGEEKPTFLATPVCTKASSFGDKNGKFEDKEGSEIPESGEKVKEEMGGDDGNDQLPTIRDNSENHENHDCQPTLDQN
ncbi:Protein GLUTAMINE DUMPER 1 [Hibiscus syriacus]|uniref:Protein GLUTAMINE DUMPER 1 n=1 Tax=Hibiscus syriacus TaxID=106335 RepID=A0A6A3A8K9_HIBSY|nr:protein GLUTAMINE DUMPER 3-like [Hibiscus syriacus]KAE8700296.1 Protein GLUTAMINE DUMPER 1 [Hibiscus syriacus]